MGKLSIKLLVLLGYFLLFMVATFFALNIEAYVQEAQADRLLVDGIPEHWRLNLETFPEYVAVALGVVTGPYGIGFLLGALLFSIPDIPGLVNWIRNKKLKRAERKRNPEKDNKLADQCDELAKQLFDEAAAIEKIRMDFHWSEDSTNKDASKGHWLAARRAEAKEGERVQRNLRHKIAKVFSELEVRGINMELLHAGMGAHDLSPLAVFFTDVALALRSGEYRDKVFKVDPFRGPRF